MAISRAAFNFTGMRFTGQLQQNTPIVDASGGQTDNFSTMVTTRVYLEKVHGYGGMDSGRVEFIKNYLLKCRYQTAITINEDSRWLINGEAYDIQDWERVDMIPKYYIMTVVKNQ